MKILALETSSEFCSVALWLDGDVRAEQVLAGQRHSELLLPMAERLLKQAGVGLRQLDGIAFGAGPGAFTGLRIGCGVAQGLAFGSGLPVVAVGTLLALAEASGAPRAVCCIDARMGEIYHAAYEKSDDSWVAVHQPSLCAPHAAPQVDAAGWVGCGSGFRAYRDALGRRYGDKLIRIADELVPGAREIVILGAQMLERGEGVAPEHAAPLYVRDKVALKVNER